MPTYKQKYNKKYGFSTNEDHSLSDIAKTTGIKKSILQQVYNRGTGAWKTNLSSVRLKKDFSKNPNTKKYPRSKRISKEAWSFARVYSFVVGGKTQKTADKDLWEKAVKGKSPK